MSNGSILAIATASVIIDFSYTTAKQLRACMRLNYTRKPNNWSIMRKKNKPQRNTSLDSKSILGKARTIILRTAWISQRENRERESGWSQHTVRISAIGLYSLLVNSCHTDHNA